ncbi:MAG: crossover junction endodeoxyribonuclease RuvC [Acidobacteria bacterium]|nr:crossover junction endodeoxyribonuclease RuvC [Acidobacteriota bacterium]
MKVLGIDPGSVATGYGIVSEVKGNLTLIAQGSIRAGRVKDDFPARLQLIFEGLQEVIATHKPEAAAIETPFAGRNVRSLVQLAQARGVAVLAARLAGLEIFEYAPSAVKNAIVGYGRAEKPQVARMVKMLLPGMRDVALGPDAADALAVAICHVHVSKFTRRIRG